MCTSSRILIDWSSELHIQEHHHLNVYVSSEEDFCLGKKKFCDLRLQPNQEYDEPRHEPRHEHSIRVIRNQDKIASRTTQ